MSARLLAPVAVRAIHQWNDGLAKEWKALHRQVLGPRQRRCRMVARVLRSPLLRRFAVQVLSMFPYLSRPLVASLNFSTQLPRPTTE
jgi:hypothetical protein